MGQKIFVSYKYSDNNVCRLSRIDGPAITVREYVTYFQSIIDKRTTSINKGERDNEDLSCLAEDTIWEKLKDRIYDSSVTVVFISPGMRDASKEDRDQWIPWEVAFSLREQTRGGRTSRPNSLVYVVLPDRGGSYNYCAGMGLFRILQKNMDNGYAVVADWRDFIENYQLYIDLANHQRDITPISKIVKIV